LFKPLGETRVNYVFKQIEGEKSYESSYKKRFYLILNLVIFIPLVHDKVEQPTSRVGKQKG